MAEYASAAQGSFSHRARGCAAPLVWTSLAGALLLTPAASRPFAAIHVSAGGDLQAALDAAKPGDTILLAEGAVFTGTFVLRDHGGSVSITVRTDAPDLPRPGERTGPAYSGRLAVLQSGTTAPALRTAPGAHHWRIENVAFGANRNGAGDVIALGDGSSAQSERGDVPHDLVLDRVYLTGDAAAGQKRGIALNSASTHVVNSHVAGIRAVGVDSQAIAGWNGPGPFTIENNYLEAAGENVMFGGADPAIAGLVPTGIVIRRNHFAKPLSWREAVLPAPHGVRTSAAASGGSLHPGTYTYRVAAEGTVAGARAARSAPSRAVETAVGGTGSAAVVVEWTPVAGASAYQVHRRGPDGSDAVLRTKTPRLVDDGTGSRPGRLQERASRWTVKNLLELKSARDVEIDGNLFERSWRDAQTGSAIVIKPTNQNGRAPWATIENVRFTNNLVRHAGSGVNLAGEDPRHPAQRARGILIRGNVFVDIDGDAWGGDGALLQIGGGPVDVVVEDNAARQSGTIIDVYPGKTFKTAPGFVFRGNLVRHNRYGVKGPSKGSGTPTLDAYFPGAVFVSNVIAGDGAGRYPPGNRFVSGGEFERAFRERVAAHPLGKLVGR